MDHPGHILVNHVSNWHAYISMDQLLWTQDSDLSSQNLYALGNLSGHSGPSLVLCRIRTHQCRVEVETDPSMIQIFLVVDTGGMTEKQATGNISKSLNFVHVDYGIHRN